MPRARAAETGAKVKSYQLRVESDEASFLNGNGNGRRRHKTSVKIKCDDVSRAESSVHGADRRTKFVLDSLIGASVPVSIPH
jgi:hypothetical protein